MVYDDIVMSKTKTSYPSDKQDQFMVRMPDGMRERIRLSAERNGRSMNAEIVQALEQFFPTEPTTEEVIERLHQAIDQSNRVAGIPYRRVLLHALDGLAERLSKGIEFDQFQSKTAPDWAVGFEDVGTRMRRWRRAQDHGVEQSDLQQEIDKGLFSTTSRMTAHTAISLFRNDKPKRALAALRLNWVKFAEPEAAYTAIEKCLRDFYEENWGDPDEEYYPGDM